MSYFPGECENRQKKLGGAMPKILLFENEFFSVCIIYFDFSAARKNDVVKLFPF